ncbi:MAG TPA: GNAT family N-acetyltransferase [Thermoleophilaceae bacterium]|nr:GNAT family N-acetyltransferase [Thermoleophilaceae bacterium]
MQTRFLTLDRLEPQHELAWRRLVDRSVDANPFFEPDFLMPAARHLGARGGGLLVLEDSTDWLACLPVTSRATKLQVPVLAGWRTPYTFLGTPLVAQGHEDALPELLLDGLKGRLSGVAMVDQVPRASGAWAALADSLVVGDLVAVARRDFERAAFDPSVHGTQLPLSSKRRANLRRTRRRLEERLGADAEFVQLEADERNIRRFLELEASGWKGNAGTAVAAQPEHAVFFADLCWRFALAGRLELTAIRCAGRTVAMATMLTSRDCRFAFKLAFDEEFRQQAPGTQLIVEVAEHCSKSDVGLIDSCSDPENDTMNRLWPDRRPLVSVVLARPGVRAGVLKRAARLAGAAGARDAVA